MRRLLKDARRALEEEVIPSVNDHWGREYRKVLETLEAKAKARASEHVERREVEANTLRDAASRELASVRDDLDDLSDIGRSGRMPANEYNERLRNLRRRQHAAEQQLGRVEEIVGRIAEVEEDPIGWFDEAIATRFPRLRPEVPW